MSTEQRRNARIPLHVEFRGKDLSGTGALLFEGADLSIGGAFLKSDLLLEAGESLTLEFRVPGLPRLLRANGKVAWVRRFPGEGELPGMGVQFLAMTEADRAVLAEYLEAG